VAGGQQALSACFFCFTAKFSFAIHNQTELLKEKYGLYLLKERK
jgi:hypothetical protein